MKINLDYIAAVCESVFYAGRPKSSKKLDREDFKQMARMANGSIMRRLYYEERENRQQFWFFSDQLMTKTFKLSKPDLKGRREIVLQGDEEKKAFDGIIRLPNGLAIYEVSPVGDCPCPHIARAEPGSEWLYCGKDYEGLPHWTQKGKKIVAYQLDECIEELEILGIFNDDDLEVPFDIAFDIVNAVLGVSLKVAGFPVDKTNNADPNLLTIKSRLAEPNTI